MSACEDILCRSYRSFARGLKRCRLRLRRCLRGKQAENYSEIELLHQRLTAGVNAGRIMIDVGAQFGESFAPFRLYGWGVLAFEPDPNPRKQAALLRLTDDLVEVRQLAVAEQVREAATFYGSDLSTGISTLEPFHESHRAVAKVDVSTLAIELTKARLPRVDFLKIDTEGHDLFVLKGYPWERAELKPRVVLCEFEDAKTVPLGYTWRDMADFLVAQGYGVLVSEWKPIVRYGVKHDWVGVQCFPDARVNDAGWGNLIALAMPADLEWFAAESANYIRK